MKYGTLIIEKKEYERVKKIVVIGRDSNDSTQNTAIRKLINELKSAQIMKAVDMPEDVVRLNSTVMFTMPDKKIRKFKIVLPNESDVAQKRLSLLSPMGLALFGYAKGDAIEWQFPSGVNQIEIVEVTQEKNIHHDTV
jgi:regulator of nucleoside diphosphate kinase